VTAFRAPTRFTFHSRYDPGYHLLKPRVTYTYEVRGVLQRSTSVSFGPDRDGGLNVERARRYAVGSDVKVFYNPERPWQAVLEPGVTRRVAYVHIFLSIVAIGLGLFILTR
jgi:hypothetical protein